LSSRPKSMIPHNQYERKEKEHDKGHDQGPQKGPLISRGWTVPRYVFRKFHCRYLRVRVIPAMHRDVICLEYTPPPRGRAGGDPPDDPDHVSKPYTTTYAVRIARKTGTESSLGRHASTILSNFARNVPERKALFLFGFPKTITAVSTFFSAVRITVRGRFSHHIVEYRPVRRLGTKNALLTDNKAGKALLFFWLKPL